MIKEATATVFVFREHPDAGWQVAMIWHPRMGGWLPPGGHVEADENAAEAAAREVEEELGCRIRLVAGPTVPLPEGFPHSAVVAPWWVVEMAASPDSHTASEHVHIDHVFVALWDRPARPAQTAVRWFDEQALAAEDDIAWDSRLQAAALFARLSEIMDLVDG